VTGVTDLLDRTWQRVGYIPARQRVDLAQYRTEAGIVRFVREILRADPAPYQEDILRALVCRHRAAARGPHGLGKTALAAWAVLWVMTCFESDVKAPTTASAWRQLEKFLWPEIRKWARRGRWDRLGLDLRDGRELLMLSLRLGDKEAFAVASDSAALIEGAHATTLLYVFDEAKAIPVAMWDAAEGAYSGAGADTGSQAFALAISTPGEPSGRFYDIHSRKPGYEDWWTRHVTLAEAVDAGRISREWVEQRRAQWGEGSTVYQNRVLGEFASAGEDSVIPLAWVEQAIERWHACGGKGLEGTSGAYGVDPARYGEDKTAIARVVGPVCEWVRYTAKEDTMQTAGRVAALAAKNSPIGVDVIGVGAGVYDRLRELGYQGAVAVNVAERTPLVDTSGQIGFVNIRAAIWWMLRDALDPHGGIALAIPPDDRLIGDLTAPTWSYTSAGKIKVESKDDIRARLGRSTDAADALGLARYVATVGMLTGPLMA
jgi:hypothetical protein